jgi:hypothetical protein
MTRRVEHEIVQLIYVIAGLPLAIRGPSLPGSPASREIRRAFARAYWRPTSLRQGIELVLGWLAIPLAVPLTALWYTVRNGPIIRRREGNGLAAQFWEQLQLYSQVGILGPWYYTLSLHRDGARRAPSFLQRCETKRGIYALLKSEGASPLGDKRLFADRCAAAGVRCAGCELVVDGETNPAELPDCDLFVKPLTGNGGRGAERWDRVAARQWSNGAQVCDDRSLVELLRSRRRPLIVQKRVRTHPALVPLTAGAVPTVRALTCLDEDGVAELVGAVFRMSIGDNRTVDNFHAGGIACAVALDTGELGLASDLGLDARLGWLRHHPTTSARIAGTRLPCWDETRALACQAHAAFGDRVVIGWDIAIAEDGPVVIEGNRGPDTDIMQRFMETGFCNGHRLTDLLAHHLRARGHIAAADVPASVIRMNAQRQ